jgi:hypothetical protein
MGNGFVYAVKYPLVEGIKYIPAQNSKQPFVRLLMNEAEPSLALPRCRSILSCQKSLQYILRSLKVISLLSMQKKIAKGKVQN